LAGNSFPDEKFKILIPKNFRIGLKTSQFLGGGWTFPKERSSSKRPTSDYKISGHDFENNFYLVSSGIPQKILGRSKRGLFPKNWGRLNRGFLKTPLFLIGYPGGDSNRFVVFPKPPNCKWSTQGAFFVGRYKH